MEQKNKHYTAILVLAAIIFLGLITILCIYYFFPESLAGADFEKGPLVIKLSGAAALFWILFKAYTKAFKEILMLLTVTLFLLPFMLPLLEAPSVISNPTPVDNSPPPQEVAQSEDNEPTLNCRTIYFDKYSNNLDARAEDCLRQVAEYSNHANHAIRLEGHTDEEGSREENFALAQQQANLVKTFLMNYGVPSERIIVISYGEEKPRELNNHEANNRIEIIPLN